MRYSTIFEFHKNHPLYTEAYQFVAVSESGEIHQWVFPVESFHSEIQRLMVEYVYVNNWRITIQQIVVN